MRKLLFLSLPLLALLASCSSTPTSRIAKNPALYEKLSAKDQKLVSEGRIDKGMTKPAVFLALGHPSSKVEGDKNGKKFEHWNYTVLTPVYTGGFRSHIGYGRFGRGGFGRRGFHGSNFGFGYHPSVSYVPRQGASVAFSDDRVSGWSVISRN